MLLRPIHTSHQHLQALGATNPTGGSSLLLPRRTIHRTPGNAPRARDFTRLRDRAPACPPPYQASAQARTFSMVRSSGDLQGRIQFAARNRSKVVPPANPRLPRVIAASTSSQLSPGVSGITPALEVGHSRVGMHGTHRPIRECHRPKDPAAGLESPDPNGQRGVQHGEPERMRFPQSRRRFRKPAANPRFPGAVASARAPCRLFPMMCRHLRLHPSGKRSRGNQPYSVAKCREENDPAIASARLNSEVTPHVLDCGIRDRLESSCEGDAAVSTTSPDGSTLIRLAGTQPLETKLTESRTRSRSNLPCPS